MSPTYPKKMSNIKRYIQIFPCKYLNIHFYFHNLNHIQEPSTHRLKLTQTINYIPIRYQRISRFQTSNPKVITPMAITTLPLTLTFEAPDSTLGYAVTPLTSLVPVALNGLGIAKVKVWITP